MGPATKSSRNGECDAGWTKKELTVTDCDPTLVTCWRCTSDWRLEESAEESCTTPWSTTIPDCTPPVIECDSWEKVVSDKCVLKDNACNTYDDCDSRAECDSHWCEPISMTDPHPCDAWEDAVNRDCVLKSGACNIKSDCGSNEECDSHRCEVIAGAGIVQPKTCTDFWEDPENNCEPNWLWIILGALMVVLLGVLIFGGGAAAPPSGAMPF